MRREGPLAKGGRAGRGPSPARRQVVMPMGRRSGFVDGRVAASPPTYASVWPELAFLLHQAPDPGAIRAPVGLDVGGRLLDGGQVDAEQLRAPLQRGRGRPARIRVVPSPHRTRLWNTYGSGSRSLAGPSLVRGTRPNNGQPRTITDTDAAVHGPARQLARPPSCRSQRRGHPELRAAFAACQRGSGHRGRASPSSRAGAVAARCERRSSRRRATRVPQAAVTSGIQRIVTVTRRGRQAGRRLSDLG
jgi:hypothetical protein